MSNPAQEEADQIFGYKEKATAHPEDRNQRLTPDIDDERPTRPTIRNESREQNSDDEDNAHTMATMIQSKQTYTLPSGTRYANTGPKGVIADAQNYQRAKRTTFRPAQRGASNNLSVPFADGQLPHWTKTNENNSFGSDIDLEDDSEFMQQWRQQRLTELKSQFSGTPQVRRVSPSRRLFGTLDEVDANGYLDAIEKAPNDMTVVVMLFDPHSTQSLEVEDQLKMMAYRWSHIHFVKLDHEIAEMETVEIPAILAYKRGNVFATISGAKGEGLEGALTQQGILVR